MLSVIIPTHNSERALVTTLAALVSGAIAGLVAEVILADSGSSDDTAAVADVAGCKLMVSDAPLAARLKAAAAAARAPWLMFVKPGTVLEPRWTAEVGRFVQQYKPPDEAAVFRRSTPSRPMWREILALLAATLGAPHPDQGLLISKKLYVSLGGHSEDARDPETDLIRRIGRSRIITLSTGAFAEMLD